MGMVELLCGPVVSIALQPHILPSQPCKIAPSVELCLFSPLWGQGCQFFHGHFLIYLGKSLTSFCQNVIREISLLLHA